MSTKQYAWLFAQIDITHSSSLEFGFCEKKQKSKLNKRI